MAESTQITNLVINLLSKEQYKQAKEEEKINENELYLVKTGLDIEIEPEDPEEDTSGDIIEDSGRSNISILSEDDGVITISSVELGKSYSKSVKSGKTVIFEDVEDGTWTVTLTLTDGSQVDGETLTLETDHDMVLTSTKIYGICRDTTELSSTWTRTKDAVGMTAKAASYAGDEGKYYRGSNSDFDDIYPWSEIRRVTFNSTSDVMVLIPKFYYKRYIENNIEHIQISGSPVTGFKLHPAFISNNKEVDCIYVGAYEVAPYSRAGLSAGGSVSRESLKTSKGDGWYFLDISALSALQMLILVEYASYDVQSCIGLGYITRQNSGISVTPTTPLKTGTTDSMYHKTYSHTGFTYSDSYPNASDHYAYNIACLWRGIENLWGNSNEFIDGVLITRTENLYTTEINYYICTDRSKYSDTITEDYKLLSYKGEEGETMWIKSNTQGLRKLGIDSNGNEHIMLPQLAGTGVGVGDIVDIVDSSETMYLFNGGNYTERNNYAGLFNYGSLGVSKVMQPGSRLLYIPESTT